MNAKLPVRSIAIASLAIAMAGATTVALATPPAASNRESTVQTPVPNLRQPTQRLMTGGQPDASSWSKLAEEGVTTVINLRPDSEIADRDEAAEVAAAGMAYRQIPVAGAAAITAENADALWSAIAQAQASGKVLVHCASGNRVGALLALGAARQGGQDAPQALQFGKDAGLTGAEPRVRELLGLPPAD